METRFERKWKINKIYFNQLFNALRNSKFCFFNKYEPRWINSIYYDDVFFSSVKENLDGVKEKKKVRIRWYGDQYKTRTINLELKKKIGFICQKQKKKFLLKNPILNKKNLDYLKKEIIEKYPFFIKFNQVASTRYFRYYLISHNKKVRATIDTEIEYRKFDLNNDYLGKIKDKNIVLEFKYDTIHDEYCRRNFENNFLRFTKNSKYTNSFFWNNL